MNWDADDNGDGHLDLDADDPRNPPDDEPDYRQEGHMVWLITSRRLERSGMWQAEARAGTCCLVSKLSGADATAVADVLAQVADYERAMGVHR